MARARVRELVWLCLAALCGALAALAGCSGRERSNPFDPGNPETRGQPASFVAVASNRAARLAWSPLETPGLVGYRLSRRAPGEADFRPVGGGVLAPEVTEYEDLDLANDSTYVYRLSFVLTGGLVGPPAERAARPGPAVAWVADAGADLILRITPDGRHRTLALPGLDTPADVEVDPARHRVWASSRTLGYVAVWGAAGLLVAADGSFRAPAALALVPGSSLAYVAEERSGEVSLWDSEGARVLVLGGLDLPADVALARGTGDLWIAERGARRLVAVPLAGRPRDAVDLPGRPWRLAVDEPEGGVWVSYPEDGAVERRAADGRLLARVEKLAGAFALAPDPARARVWVTLADGDALVALDRSGRELQRIAGLREPRGVAVDGRTGEIWATTLGRGDGDGSLWLFSPQGQLLSRLGGFVRPVAVALDAAP